MKIQFPFVFLSKGYHTLFFETKDFIASQEAEHQVDTWLWDEMLPASA
jgi:hypothetical protein